MGAFQPPPPTVGNQGTSKERKVDLLRLRNK